jgi:hypothetical protein
MTKLFQIKFLSLIIVIVGLSNCANLKHVNNFSSTSLNSLEKFEDINYSFEQNCIDNCLDKKINDLALNLKDCDCQTNRIADSATFVIYNSLRAYLEGLLKISNNELTTYKMDAMNKSLKEGEFGPVKIEKNQADAYSKISKTILRAFTDGYRKKKIKDYVKEANEPFKVLIYFLDFNLSSNLVGKLNVKKKRLESTYFDLSKDETLSNYEKRKVVEEYYQKVSEIEYQQNELFLYSKALRKIAAGHQKLLDNIETLSTTKIKEELTQFSSDIKDIVSEYNKLKK